MKEFFGNVKQEFRKITWPTDKEMKLHTTQVFVFMVVLSLFFAVVDAVISVGVDAATHTPSPIVEEGDYDFDLEDLLDYDSDEDIEDEDTEDEDTEDGGRTNRL